MDTNKIIIEESSGLKESRSSMLTAGCLAMVLFLFANLQAEEFAVADWVERQNWFANLEASFPVGVSLSISSGGEDEPGWESVQIREVHSAESGADESVSPTVGFFRVSENREMVEWMDPVSGEWESLSAFLRSRRAAMPQVAGATNAAKEMAGPGKDAGAVPSSTKERELAGDLDGDGKPERVLWKPLDFFGSDKFFYLEVIDEAGAVLWTGPQERSMENAYIFFDSHIGSSVPQLLFDVDGDGRGELLAPEPQSDVSVTFFRRLRWKDGSFRPLSSAGLVPVEPDSDTFIWREEDLSLGTWVSQFGGVTPEGLVQARVTRYTEDGEWKGGAALLRFTPEGATVAEWVHPLSANPPQITMANDATPAPETSGADKLSGFPLACSILIEYSDRAFNAIQASGGKLRASLIVDQYGPQYVEEESVAVLNTTIALGETLNVSGIPFSQPGYRVNPDKTYKLTVMILRSEEADENLLLEAYSPEGAVDWVTSEIQGRALTYYCKLASEEGEPPMVHSSGSAPAGGGESGAPYNPFSDVDMDAFFAQ
ncbi:hypothetical protein VSU19_16490 [Verrucomicrobiales bacterium BCK34]|nr:hypothetical protein [Verrucomicrobiales bacterium BCK34]